MKLFNQVSRSKEENSGLEMSNISIYEEKFHKLLALLASRCGSTMDIIEVEIYDKYLGETYGYEKACEAIQKIIIERDGRDPLPSVSRVAALIDPHITEKSAVMDITNKICRAISTKGYNWAEKLPIGLIMGDALIVEFGASGANAVGLMGGWERVCEYANANPSHYRHWIKDTVSGAVEHNKVIAISHQAERLKIEKRS